MPGFGLRVRHSLRKEGTQPMKPAASDTLQALETVLTILKDALKTPSVENDLSVPICILKKVQKATVDIEGVDTLRRRVDDLLNALRQLFPPGRSPDKTHPALKRVEPLVRRWALLGGRLQTTERRFSISRLFRSDLSIKTMTFLVAELDASIQEFLQEEDLRPDGDSHGTDEEAKDGQMEVDETEAQQAESEMVSPQIKEDVETSMEITHKAISIDAEIGQDLLLPRYTRRACFDANNVKRTCLQGTRTFIFDMIRNWVALACTESSLAGRVLWINGPAGSGKTTIAYSIANEYKEQDMLGGSFFCSRFDTECSDPNMVFTTLSHQLCSYHDHFRAKVAAVLRDSPDIADASPARQLEELIVRPLQEVCDTFPRCVIVIDALDECKDATSTILAVLAQFIDRLDRLLFIVTSRPEARIAAQFQAPGTTLQAVTTPLALAETDLDSARDDIELYLGYEFGAAQQTMNVPEGWPLQQDIDALADRSDGLWIHAVTTVKFVLDPNHGNPEGRLQLLLSDKPIAEHPALHSLYAQITNAAYSTAPEEILDQLHPILGILAVSREPLSITTIAVLLGVSENIVRGTLQRLHSVLEIPADHSSAVRVSHPTFLEFLTSPLSSKSDAFCIEPTKHHIAVFSHCLDVMLAHLKYDICDIGDPTLFRNEIPTLSEMIEQRIPSSLRYACWHWVAHFSEATCAEAVAGGFTPFQEFLHRHLLNWFETCSLLGALDNAVTGIDMARRTCQALAGPFLDFVPLLYDCRRFILTFAAPIDSAPLQVCYSALTLTPHTTLMARQYPEALGRRDCPFVVHGGVSPEWNPCFDVFFGHGGVPVRSVAFSPDGVFFASGGQDSSIKIWRATTRTLFLAIRCPASTTITSLAFSPDGVHIASTLDYGIVRVWQTSTGASVHTLESGANWVRFVTYSSDGTRILTASGDGQIRLWDSTNGHPLLTLDGALAARQAALSPDGSILAYGAGESLQLYHTLSGESESLAMSRKTVAAAFSANGRHMAVAMQSQISIWSYPSKVLLRSYAIPYSPCRMVFSSDGQHLAYGLYDGSVHLWHVTEDERPFIFKAHDNSVHDIAWSPDGSQIVTVGLEGTIRVWDMTRQWAVYDERSPFPATVSHEDAPPRPPSPTPARDLQQCIAGDQYIQALAAEMSSHQRRDAFEWFYVTGRPSATLYGWPREVLSHDGNLKLVVQSPQHPRARGRTAEILDTRTGTATPLRFPPGYVSSAAFSYNSEFLAIGSVEGSVEVLDRSLGLVAAHHHHSGLVATCSFSSNGTFVVSGSDSFVFVFEIAFQEVTHRLGPHQGSVVNVALGLDDETVLSQDSSHKFYLWHAPSRDGHPSVLLRYFLLDDDAWLHVLDFGQDDSSMRFRGHEDDRGDAVSLWTPGSRSWPVYHVTNDGWVYAKGPGIQRRLGWIVPSWRHPLGFEGGTFWVFDDIERKRVELEFPRITDSL